MSGTRTMNDPVNRDRKDPEKTVDLPPYGPRNPDPLTDAPGSHPIETGIGAVIGGAASGLALGAVGGPIGAVVGAIVGGAAAGGLAGKGIGELIDPTTEDNWIRDYLKSRAEPPAEEEVASLRRAFRFGLAAQSRFPGQMFQDVEPELRRSWEDSGEPLGWARVRDAVRVGFDRTMSVTVIPVTDERDATTRY